MSDPLTKGEGVPTVLEDPYRLSDTIPESLAKGEGVKEALVDPDALITTERDQSAVQE